MDKTKKRSPWMRLFTISKPLTPAELVAVETMQKTVDRRNQRVKNGR